MVGGAHLHAVFKRCHCDQIGSGEALAEEVHARGAGGRREGCSGGQGGAREGRRGRRELVHEQKRDGELQARARNGDLPHTGIW